MLTRLSTRQLRALYRIVKHPTKGVRPFFADVHAVIRLRQEVERRAEAE